MTVKVCEDENSEEGDLEAIDELFAAICYHRFLVPNERRITYRIGKRYGKIVDLIINHWKDDVSIEVLK